MRFKNVYKEEIKKYVAKNNLKYYIDTMGCAMNENDSSKYAGILESMGFTKAEDIDKSNLVLFNTCSVRENAENTLYGRLGSLKKKKKEDSNTIICVVGCMSQQKHVIEKIKESYPYTDIVLGTYSMISFPEKLYNVIMKKERQYEYIEISNDVIEEVPIIYESDKKASVSIIYGCNNFCTFCIVPHVRGRERSRMPEDILKDVKHLAEKGYKEIMLLGQNVNSYGKDLNINYTFADLLKDLDKIEGIEIIRFTSPHPKDFSEDVIDVIASSKKISHLLHLPLQSGNTRVLKKMNRKYTKEQYLELVDRIKSKIPDVSFSTDIIVGFPGETAEEFEDTMDVVNKVKFEQIFMFIYSKRESTPAAEMEDGITYEEKVERLEILKKKFEEITNEKNEKMIGQVYEILIEGKSKTNDKLYTGRTLNNKVVIFDADETLVGKIVNVEIIKNNLWYLTGKIVG
ncbi:MAG: tRNA (N6-isopentenyl adenosine(37)-C2)-methylthiotransferase MiaB [Clostridia bacterium]|nr:tRNA (N6-isopentenyl adenosine(37)-C2)-methylthiotransferase MiaB [Clostridia bacterium]